MNACAIDFETSCGNRASACAVGLAKIRDGEITSTYSSLIKPPKEMPILPFFENIHGVTNKMVCDKPSFYEVWPKIKDFIGNDILIAHNAGFDRSVLQASLAYWGISSRIPRFECTLLLSRRNWPYLYNHKLSTVCDFLGIELSHHDALSDTVASGLIWILCRSKG